MSWPQFEIKEVARVVGGATPKSGESTYWDGDIDWVTPKDLADLDSKFIDGTPRKITQAGLRSCSAERLPTGSVLFSSRAPIGHIAINSTPMATNQGFKSFIPGPDLDASFLYWWLDANRERLQAMGNGATFKEVSKAVVERIVVPVPPLPEQRRIAAILDQADALRRLRRRSLTELENLGRSIFAELLGEDLKCEGFLSLGEFADIQIGYPFKSNLYSSDDNGISLCRGANVLPDTVDWSDHARYPRDLAENHIAFELRDGDVVLAMDRPWISSGFKVASVQKRDLPALLVQRVARLRSKEDFDRRFLFHLTRSDQFQRHCRPTETTVPHISPVEIRNFMFHLPNEHKRRAFDSAISQVDEAKSVAQEHFDLHQKMFASLQYRAFRGEL
ncbi:restriction endonuclease subunit S [Sphingobium yanoikuyae]|uniref:Restriction endonuclease subunit S n=1 Tax=Sphingobium yanoikuyae TaxID=13690 RepID=A0A3G2UR63_SPHYA|nr:restriction endonuclease subunit S [Sphingobium yanoikuyae]AYO77463.1 restriction endonuclease subunit S [Sphingobium yanoikuyae]